MFRRIAPVRLLILVIPALWVVLGPGPIARAGSDADSARAALERELAEFAVGLDAGPYDDDPFESGRVPDVTLLASTDVHGEVAPCG